MAPRVRPTYLGVLTIPCCCPNLVGHENIAPDHKELPTFIWSYQQLIASHIFSMGVAPSSKDFSTLQWEFTHHQNPHAMAESLPRHEIMTQTTMLPALPSSWPLASSLPLSPQSKRSLCPMGGSAPVSKGSLADRLDMFFVHASNSSC